MLEKEIKLGAGPGFHLPNLDDIAEGVTPTAPETLRLSTVYYDTADLRIARWGCSLRHRATEGWTVKLPSSANGVAMEREELNFPGGRNKPPEGATKILRAYIRHAELIPVVRLATRRQRVQLVDANGTKLAEVVDDEVSVLNGRHVASRFREVELELSEAGADLQQPVLVRLRRAGAGAPDPTSKQIRALGPLAQEPPEVAPVTLSAPPLAKEVIQNVIAESVADLLRHDPGVRLGSDPEHVHQARVATRRLRSHLRTFQPLLDPDWVGGLRDELGWIAAELGAVRDLEVMLERLQKQTSSLPPSDARPVKSLTDSLSAEVEKERKKLDAHLGSERYVDLLERLVEGARSPLFLPEAEGPAADVLPKLTFSSWKKLRSAVGTLPSPPADADLHNIRILAKRARYAAEAVAPAVGERAKEFAAAAAKLQTVLGEHQDAVTMKAWLRTAAGSGRRAFVAGQLVGKEDVARMKSTRQWRSIWKSLDRKRLRMWMITPGKVD